MVKKIEYNVNSFGPLLLAANKVATGKESQMILDCMRSVIMDDISYLSTARKNIEDGIITILDIFALGYHGQTSGDVGLLAGVIYGHSEIDSSLAEQAVFSLRSMIDSQLDEVVKSINTLSSFIWDHQQRGICWRVLAETYSLLPKDSLNFDVVHSAYSTFENLPRNSKTGLNALRFLHLIPNFTESESLSLYLAQKYDIATPSQKMATLEAMTSGIVVPFDWLDRLDVAWGESIGDELSQDDIAKLATMVSSGGELLEILFVKILKSRQHNEWTDRERDILIESGTRGFDGVFSLFADEFESMSEENRNAYLRGLLSKMRKGYRYGG